MYKKILLLSLMFSAVTSWCLAGQTPYDYPVANRFAATILGTPKEFAAILPKKIKTQEMELIVFPDRVVPEFFWYQKGLQYSLARQRGKAPLIFLIAGTGAGHNSAKNQALAKAFYQAGFHVVSLSSPTHPNFIITASSTMIPGHIVHDAEDLYRVMELIMKQNRNRLEVTDFYLTGYSLGGAQAAFVAKLDEERKAFNFKKVLMINPPVSLYNSVTIIDSMLENNIPGGIDKFEAFWDDMFKRFSDAYRDSDVVTFGPEFLYKAYEERLRAGTPPDDGRMEALIGFAFRISSAGMVFTSDVMSNYGLIKPKNLVLYSTDSVTDYAKVAGRANFITYFDLMLYPYYHAQQPGLSRQEMLDLLSLKSIEGYLRSAKKIGMVSNVDDFILAPGEVDYFRQVFQDRAKFYPKGGHCGNITYKDNVAYMINYFTN